MNATIKELYNQLNTLQQSIDYSKNDQYEQLYQDVQEAINTCEEIADEEGVQL